MCAWHTLSARFNDKELQLIRRYQEKHDVTDNELIRNGVTFIVGLMTMFEAFENPNLGLLRDYLKEVRKELNSPRYKKAMERATTNWASKLKQQQLQNLEAEFSLIQKELEVFQEKRPRGRPKIKRGRGRPVNKGSTD